MDIGPIWRAMLKNKAGFVLIALQIAVTLTIMVNAFGIMRENAVDIARESGLDEANTFALVSVLYKEYELEDRRALLREDLETIRNVPGVVAVTPTNSYPLRQGGWSMALRLQPGTDQGDSVGSAIYFADEAGVDTFDVSLIDGKGFTLEHIVWRDPDVNQWPPHTIITEALGKEMWPEETGSYVGKTLYVNDYDPMQVIGVVDRLQAPWPGWSGVEQSMLVPWIFASDFSRYLIRTEPGMRDTLMPQIESLLAESNKDRIIRDVTTMEDARRLAYTDNAALIKILGFTVTLLTIITGLGIVGLASFNVSRRTRQIGIRRALGATRPAIVRYFMIENGIVSTIGLVIGGAMTIGLNILMVEAFSLDPLKWYFVPAGMVALWIVGQIAVAGPARRASNITPAIATRSV